jgi:hypothetical protein
MTSWAQAAAEMIRLTDRLGTFRVDLRGWAAAQSGSYSFTRPDGAAFELASVPLVVATINAKPDGAAAAAIVSAIAAIAALADELDDWSNGTASGGPGGDGLYPVSQPGGVAFLLPSEERVEQLYGELSNNAASRMIVVVEALASLLGELANWASGTADGGPDGNGLYPFVQPDGTVIKLPSLPLILADAIEIQSPARLRRVENRIAFAPQTGSCVDDANTPGVGTTWHQMMTLETGFTRPQIMFENHLDVPVTIGPIKAATAANVDEGFGNDLVWQFVLFDGVPMVTIPAGLSVSSNTGIANNPALALSDPIDITSAPRTDLPARGLLLLRTFLPQTIERLPLQADYTTPPYIPLGPYEENGRTWWSWRADGDHVTDTRAYPADAQLTNRWPCVAVVATSTHPGGRCAILVNPGDSIQNGGYGGMGGHVYKAMGLVNGHTLPLGFVGMGWIGQSSTLYLRRAQRMFPILKPHIAFYTAWSPNDDPSPDAGDVVVFKANLEAFLDLCDGHGVTPILGTATPMDDIDAAQDALRREVNDYIRAKAGKVLVADYEPVIATAATPARYKPGLGADVWHPTPEGYVAMGEVDAARLQQIIDLQFARFVPAGNPPYTKLYGGSALTGAGVGAHAVPEHDPLLGADARTGVGIAEYDGPLPVPVFGVDARVNSSEIPA